MSVKRVVLNGIEILTAPTTKIVNLATNANGTTTTSSTLSSPVTVAYATVGVAHNSRNNAFTTVGYVEGSKDGGSTWTTLVSASIYSSSNSKAAGTASAVVSDTYNRFRVCCNRTSTSWEFAVFAHGTVVYVE